MSLFASDVCVFFSQDDANFQAKVKMEKILNPHLYDVLKVIRSILRSYSVSTRLNCLTVLFTWKRLFKVICNYV